ncbi:TetR/AcrR family transcriptional regulator [Christiangramia sabulilitoris]|uniref:TetR/AcrR family transcriptional regulator n=1 Tax=Christiangramia sabulilitoris TaxID=2583991 RepID=A0A550I962_9FLAO|nr:TetR/AcrR family transcriptional regulator [Christiangramia sabulilitoris]TRO67513.1 TetR/AcrR family transcriptional regulator [Christiangramia sabulilitoris]
MKHLLQNIRIGVNEKIFLKDPETTALGKRIVENSILLIDEIGFESFTFKKLGASINSNESSIYRYFENKHKLLVYLTSWYWGWKEYQLVFATNSISKPEEKLLKAVEIVTQTVEKDESFSHINEIMLNRIIINEASKSYLTKEVDVENKDGYFAVYKRLVNRIKDMITESAQDYPFAFSLASMIVDGALHQHFLKDHFKSITDCNNKVSVQDYFSDLVVRTLNFKIDE